MVSATGVAGVLARLDFVLSASALNASTVGSQIRRGSRAIRKLCLLLGSLLQFPSEPSMTDTCRGAIEETYGFQSMNPLRLRSSPTCHRTAESEMPCAGTAGPGRF